MKPANEASVPRFGQRLKALLKAGVQRAGRQVRPTYVRMPARILVAVIGFLFALRLNETHLLQKFEHLVYDARVKLLSAQIAPDPDIVLIAIDEQSLSRLDPHLGRWPWPRAAFATVLDYCSEASVIAFDVLFPESDRKLIASDKLFVETVGNLGNIVNAIYFTASAPPVNRSTGDTRFELSRSFDILTPIAEGTGSVRPLADLLAASAAVGHVNPAYDSDGSVRQLPIVARNQGPAYPSLATAAWLHHAKIALGSITLDEQYRLHAGARILPLTEHGLMRLCPSRWPHRVYSIADIIASWQAEAAGEEVLITRDALSGKMVFIGSFATGLLEDKKATALSPATAGVEIIATAADNLMNGRYISVPPKSVWVALVALLAILPAARTLGRPQLMLPGAFLAGVAYIVVAVAVCYSKSLMLPVATPLLALFLVAGTLSSLMWYAEVKQRARLEAIDEARERFTDMLVHDMRNHIGPLMMGAQLIKAYPDDPQAQVDATNAIESSARRLLSEINALLDIRRMEEGHLHIERREMKASELFDFILKDYGPIATRSGRKIVCTLERADDIDLHIDVGLFRRVLENLVWNAIKYGSANTDIELGGKLENGRFVVMVGNRGNPLSPEKKKLLFQAFQTGSQVTAVENFPSTGIGLTFCKMVMEEHGGSIRVESPWPEYGEGVMILLQVPPAAT